MPIDNAVLTRFCDESLRPAADRLAGLLQFPGAVADAAVGQALPGLLGTTAEDLTRAEPWAVEDFVAAVTATGGEQDIVGSDAGGRTLLTTLDVLKLLRVIVWLRTAIAADPALSPLIYKFAVNPRA